MLIVTALSGAFAGAVLAADAPVISSPIQQPADDAFTLTLDRAIERVIETHPDLKIFSFTEKGLRSEAEVAAQRPVLVGGLQVENVLGTGPVTGFKEPQITLSLSSALERGGKREARQALAASRIDALTAMRNAKRLDLLAEVARRYLDVVAAQALTHIAGEDVAQRTRTVSAATKRVEAGAAPESAKLTAEALQARAQLDQDRARLGVEAAYRRLALLWGEREPKTLRVGGDPLRLSAVPEFRELSALLEKTPELQRFTDESRIREARVQLARSARSPDIQWSVGVRRLYYEGLVSTPEWALIGGVSIPFGAPHRADPEIAAANAEREVLGLERESAELSLYATLAEAYGQYTADQMEVMRSAEDVLPRLVRAEAAAERAYRAGALSYLEWAQVQTETTAARHEQLTAAIDAQRALIEIQRLTGDPFVHTADDKDSSP